MGNPRTEKKKRNFYNRCRKAQTEALLTDEVKDRLAGIDHPKLKLDDGHSMLSYVYWLIQNNYINKARQIIYGDSCSDR